MPTKALLACGVGSSLFYVGIDLLGALSLEGYSYSSQVISEMSAVGAPTRGLLLPFYLAYSLLLIAFAAGVRNAAGEDRALRAAGFALAGVGFVGLALAFFPMHMRGHAPGLTDTMHIVLSGANMLLLLAAIASAARALSRGFRLYSLGTILAMLLFGAWTGLLAPAIPEGLPTPYLGIVERLLFAAFLMWIAMLSVILLGSRKAVVTRPRP